MSIKYTIGLDFGTDSVRALIVNTETGAELASSVSYYRRWKSLQFCDASISQFRQHPLDYIESMDEVLKEIFSTVEDKVRQNIVAISVDTTGSTPVAVDADGTPLALLDSFKENPNAMFILWKDHTANQEAEEINNLSRKWKVDFTKYAGGIYSSEWFWAKILHTIRKDDEVRNHAFSWVEHCDWITAYLTGDTNPLTLKRSRCAAGHKALWHQEFSGLPSEDFLTALDPLLAGLRSSLYTDTYTSDQAAGYISAELALKYGLSNEIVIGVGAFDCHMGAVGANIQPFDFVRVMGTSTCDMLICPKSDDGETLVRGICGQVDGSITAGMIGMEAGQSAYGDYYAWWQNVIIGPVRELLGEDSATRMMEKLIPFLSDKAAHLPLTIHDPVATDWINGRRTPDANHTLKASFSGMNLSTDAVAIFKMIVEATAFGSKAIVDRFRNEGIDIHQVVAIGGVAKKSSFVMQTLCDVLDMPIKVAMSDQACALGAAINASVAGGVYPNIQEAQEAMASSFDTEYIPNQNHVQVYQYLYQKYLSLGKFTEINND